MKSSLKTVGVLVVILALVFLVNGCGSGEETGDTAGKVQPAKKVQKTGVKAKMKKVDSILPKRVLDVGLTDKQLVACEAAYNEIYSTELQAKKVEMYKKLKTLEKGTEEYDQYRTEIAGTFRPYNIEFRKKLRTLLTKEQKAKYFKKAKPEAKKTEAKTS